MGGRRNWNRGRRAQILSASQIYSPGQKQTWDVNILGPGSSFGRFHLERHRTVFHHGYLWKNKSYFEIHNTSPSKFVFVNLNSGVSHKSYDKYIENGYKSSPLRYTFFNLFVKEENRSR